MAPSPATALPNPSSTAGPARLRTLDDLPGPRPWPLLGNAPQVRAERIHLDVEAWQRRYGPLFRFSMGPLKILVVSDQAVVATLLRDRPDGLRRPERVKALLQEMGFQAGVFNAEGQAWQRQRRMVMAAFMPTHVRAYHPTLVKVATRLKERWQQAAREGRTLDLLPELMRYTVDGVAGLAFGADVNTLQSEGDIIQHHLDKVFPAWFSRITSLVPYWRVVKLPADRDLDRSVKVINQAIAGFIGDARQRLARDPSLRTAPRNLLDAMVAAADEPGSGLNDDDLAGNVITMLLAGEDTTAISITWLLYFLHRHPAALQQVRAEALRTAAGPGQPAFEPLSPEHLAGMTYLDACINETLRLKPVAPFLPLETLKEMVIADVRVPAGTQVWPLQRPDPTDPARVPDAAAFRPERWLDDEHASGTQAAEGTSLKRLSIPFGAGPRVCPGRHLAITEMKMAVATLLTHFEIDTLDTPDGQPPAERMAFTMGPVGLRMRLRERGRERGL